MVFSHNYNYISFCLLHVLAHVKSHHQVIRTAHKDNINTVH